MNKLKIKKISKNDFELTITFNNIVIGTICLEIVKNPFALSMNEFIGKLLLKENLQLTNYIFLHDFYVEKNHRNNKIGSKLIKLCIKIVEKNFPNYKIMLDAQPYTDSDLSIDKLIIFYENFGFKLIEGFGNNLMIR